MSPWREIVLEDVCDRITVGHVGKMADEYVDTGVPFLRSQNIKPFAIDLRGVLCVSEEFHLRLQKSALRGGDVVVIRTGYPGTAAVIPEQLDGSNCADLVVISPSNELNPHLLAAIFNSEWGRATVSGQLVGSAQQHFNVGSAKKMRVRLPGRREQDRIAAVVQSLGDLIQNNTRRIEILEEMARAIYREWFVEFRYPGQEDVPLVDSDLGPIPEGWDVDRVGHRLRVELGGTPSRAVEEYWTRGTVPWVNSSQVNDLRVIRGTELITEEAVQRSNTKLMPLRTTLIAITGATLGQVSLLEIDATFNQSVVGVHDPSGLSNEYLYLQILSGIEAMVAKAGGSAQQHINKAIVSDTTLVFPPASVLAQFSQIVRPIFDLIGNVLRASENLRETRDLLLPKLVSGEIDVSELELPEAV